jgi:hypothetical protein
MVSSLMLFNTPLRPLLLAISISNDFGVCTIGAGALLSLSLFPPSLLTRSFRY